MSLATTSVLPGPTSTSCAINTTQRGGSDDSEKNTAHSNAQDTAPDKRKHACLDWDELDEFDEPGPKRGRWDVLATIKVSAGTGDQKQPNGPPIAALSAPVLRPSFAYPLQREVFDEDDDWSLSPMRWQTPGQDAEDISENDTTANGTPDVTTTIAEQAIIEQDNSTSNDNPASNSDPAVKVKLLEPDQAMLSPTRSHSPPDSAHPPTPQDTDPQVLLDTEDPAMVDTDDPITRPGHKITSAPKIFADMLRQLPGLARLAVHDPHFEYRARNINGDRVQCNGCSRWMKLNSWEKHLKDGCRVYVVQPLLPVPARRILAARAPSPPFNSRSASARMKEQRRSPTNTPEPVSASSAEPEPAKPDETPSIRVTAGDKVQCDACGKWLKEKNWNGHMQKNCSRQKKRRQRWVYVEEDD